MSDKKLDPKRTLIETTLDSRNPGYGRANPVVRKQVEKIFKVSPQIKKER